MSSPVSPPQGLDGAGKVQEKGKERVIPHPTLPGVKVVVKEPGGPSIIRLPYVGQPSSQEWGGVSLITPEMMAQMVQRSGGEPAEPTANDPTGGLAAFVENLKKVREEQGNNEASN